jgi:hypothetical protein
MGKLTERLQKQLLDPNRKKDAEDCISVYNWLKETDQEGRVWSSRWDPLVDVEFKGFPSDKRTYKLNSIGRTLLNGIKMDKLETVAQQRL